MSVREPLIWPPTGTDPTRLSDLIKCLAINIEEAILDGSNAVPGKDYTVLDLYKLAAPFALQVFKADGGKTTFDVSWPDWVGREEDF